MSAQETRSVIVCRTEMHCGAEHPDGGRNTRFEGRICRAYLGAVPFLVRRTKRILAKEEEVRLGCIPAYCPRCKRYTEYEIVAPSEVIPAEALRVAAGGGR